VERTQVKPHHFWWIFAEQHFHRVVQKFVVHGRGQGIDHAVLVRNFQCVEKVDEQGLLVLHQPAADDVARDELHVSAAQCRSHGAEAFRLRLTFEEDRADLFRLRHARERGPVKVFVRGVDFLNDAHREGGRHFSKHFIGGHAGALVRRTRSGSKCFSAGTGARPCHEIDNA
jgi:hypothetical protein